MIQLIEYEVSEIITQLQYDYDGDFSIPYYEEVDTDRVATLFLPEIEEFNKLANFAIDRLRELRYISSFIYTVAKGDILSFTIIDDEKGKPLYRVVAR